MEKDEIMITKNLLELVSLVNENQKCISNRITYLNERIIENSENLNQIEKLFVQRINTLEEDYINLSNKVRFMEKRQKKETTEINLKLKTLSFFEQIVIVLILLNIFVALV